MLTWKVKINRRQVFCLVGYLVLLVFASVFIHEAGHILTATITGVPFNELKLGFWGINPGLTLPQWVDQDTRTIVFYGGGLTTGGVFLLIYLLYWVRKYRSGDSFMGWAMGLITFMLAAEQFAAGFLEGRYHSAYIMSATSLFSPVYILTTSWMIAAVFFHQSLCPPKMIKITSQIGKISD